MAVKQGDNIKVEYEGKLEDGSIFDTSAHDGHQHPLEFEAGSGRVIKGFDEAVIGMEVGEEKEVTIPSDHAYGPRNDKLTKDIPRDKLPKEQEPKEGMMLQATLPDGRQVPATVVKVTEDTVTIDLNHPLAGKTLIFKIKVVGIN
jgi:peptidylprolyl isomerase